MRELGLTQRTRFILLLAEVCILCIGSYIAFGHFLPPSGNKGFWFYTAILGLILGTRLDTPFFARPSDVILYAAPAAIAHALASDWNKLDPGEKVAFFFAETLCVFILLLGACAILAKDSRRPGTHTRV